MKYRRYQLQPGFTLIEVVVSLGMFAFAMVVIVGALVTAGRATGNDARRALAVDILHSCFRDLDLAKAPGSPPSPTLRLAPLAWSSTPVHLQLWFDADGSLVEAEKNAFFKADITATKDSGAALGHLHGRIVWPVRHGLSGLAGDEELFTSLQLP
ncbi:MAG: type II secretion system protein [Verrucomicrobia bacterium]|nr:MAG: type II secretion system protein [Verrucomicrobiota bacterium]